MKNQWFSVFLTREKPGQGFFLDVRKINKGTKIKIFHSSGMVMLFRKENALPEESVGM